MPLMRPHQAQKILNRKNGIDAVDEGSHRRAGGRSPYAVERSAVAADAAELALQLAHQRHTIGRYRRSLGVRHSTATTGTGDVLGGCGSTTCVEEIFAGDGSAIVTCVDHFSFRSAHIASMLA